MKASKIFLPSLILFWAFTALSAQQSPWQVFHAYNWQILNPAALNRYFYKNPNDIDPPVRMTGAFRTEGIISKEAPVTGFADFEVLYRRLRWGGLIMFDKTDAISNLDVSGNFCFHLTPESKKIKVSMALQPGLFIYQLNTDKLIPHIQAQNDPFLQYYKKGKWNFDCGWGLFMRRLAHPKYKGQNVWKNKSEWYLGISLPNLLVLTRRRSGYVRTGGSERTNYLNIMGGVFRDLGKNGSLEATGWLRAAKDVRFYNLFDRKTTAISLDGHLRWRIRGQQYKGYWFGGGLGTHGVGSVELGWSDSKIIKYEIGLAVSGPVFHPDQRFAENPLGVELMFTHYFNPPENLRTTLRK